MSSVLVYLGQGSELDSHCKANCFVEENFVDKIGQLKSIYFKYQQLASFQRGVQNSKKSQKMAVLDFKFLLNKMQFSHRYHVQDFLIEYHKI